MIFLFSNKNGALKDGADFMRTKNSKLHPASDGFYLTMQDNPKHGFFRELDPDSQFKDGECRLSDGEAAIIIGHGGSDNRLFDEADRDVTDAALRLMAQIAKDNSGRRYTIFLAACDSAKRQPGETSSLLSSLVQRTNALAEQLQQRNIECWGYTAEAGLVDLNSGHGLPLNLTGGHIYGTITKANVAYHCGYDRSVTAQLVRYGNGTYGTFIITQALCPLAEVYDWIKQGCKDGMEKWSPRLYETIKPTSK
jgi:hypothetical protein